MTHKPQRFIKVLNAETVEIIETMVNEYLEDNFDTARVVDVVVTEDENTNLWQAVCVMEHFRSSMP